MFSNDTIIAYSSIAAPSARILVRLSGPMAWKLANSLMEPSAGDPPASASILHASLSVRGVVFPAWLYVFAAPKSYTGEHVAELHLPGNVLIARWVMEDLIHRGARPAEPGEFTARAYFNGRMDLSAAEGVAAAIASRNERELRASRQLLAGELARRLRPIMDELAQTLALTEVGIDFSEEDVTFLDPQQTLERIHRVDADLETLLSQSRRFARLSHEPQLVLAGRPNAGKSTLLNALAGQERAVVSPVAGTTRDPLSVRIPLEHGMVNLIDAAGIEEPETPVDAIAAAMRQRALAAVDQADLLIYVRDMGDSRAPLILSRPPDLFLYTKADLFPSAASDHPAVSAKTGQGMNALRSRLDALAFGESRGDESIALNDRHLNEIAQARAALGRAVEAIPAGAELVALELREALDALGAILGVVAPDELLGRIFSSFCIGK